MLKINNLSFSYGEKDIIKDLSLSLPEKGVFVIMSPSGSGKTTLFSLIAGLLEPDSGSIETDAKKVAVSFQDDRLLPWMSAAENVNFVLGGKKNTLTRAVKHLSELGLGEDAGKYPSELSGGMKKRVSLARAFATEADLVLLDEPFNGLDADTKSVVMDKIKKVGESALVLVITHERADAEMITNSIYELYELMK